MTKKTMILLVAVVLLTSMLLTQTLAQEPLVCEDVYTVQSGDWLSKIAKKYYGDALAFDRIVEAGNAQSGDDYPDITNPDLIEPGLVLCLPPADVMAQLLQLGQDAPAGLAPRELANATYSSQYAPDGAVTLESGRFSEPIAPGSATEIKVNVTRYLAYGELNDTPSAAIVLVSDPGGSGTFYDLHVMVSQNGQPVNVASTMLGDRVDINSMTVENNQIVVDMVQAGPDDPMCCPTQQVIKTFEVQGEELVEVSSQVVEDASSGPQLTGTVWQWQTTLMNNDDQFTPDNPANYTLQFNADGTFSAQADCNQVSGSYTLEDSRLTIAPGPSTMAACPEGSLGDQFVKNLGEANSFLFDGDDLIISLMFDSGSMRFSPQAADLGQGNDLAGTSWIVLGHNNGRGGVVSSIIGTEMTAEFGADGTLIGSSGCKTYSGEYQVDGEAITISLLPVSIMIACEEPEGIMAQEEEYLAALGTVATYQIIGDKLELRTAEGSLAADFMVVK